MVPDSKTILLLMAFSAAPTALVLMAMSRFYRTPMNGVGYWCAGNLALAVGLLLLAARGSAPDFLPRVGGNGLLVITAALYHAAIRQMHGERPFSPLAMAIAVLGCGAFLAAYLTGASYATAVYALSAALAVLCAMSAARLLRFAPPQLGFAQIFTGLLFLAAALLMVVRAAYMAGAGHAPGTLFAADAAQGIILGVGHITVMLMSVGFALMIVDALAADLNRLATVDELTRVSNRRVFYARAETEMARARRAGSRFAVLMIDLDRFKAVNDQLGHALGDETLRRVADLIKPQLREYDLLARLGGEEFGVLLPDTSEEVATMIAERLREVIEQARLPHRDWPLPTTASIGVAELRNTDHSVDELMQRADRALYAAKAAGRNRTVAAARSAAAVH